MGNVLKLEVFDVGVFAERGEETVGNTASRGALDACTDDLVAVTEDLTVELTVCEYAGPLGLAEIEVGVDLVVSVKVCALTEIVGGIDPVSFTLHPGGEELNGRCKGGCGCLIPLTADVLLSALAYGHVKLGHTVKVVDLVKSVALTCGEVIHLKVNCALGPFGNGEVKHKLMP